MILKRGYCPYRAVTSTKKRTELLFNYSNLLAVEYIQPQLIHNKFDCQLSLYGVARTIQWRCKSGNSHYARQYTHYTAAYTGFSWNTGGIHPVARMFIEAHGGNHRRNLRSQFGFENLFVCHRIYPVICYRTGSYGQHFCCNAQ